MLTQASILIAQLPTTIPPPEPQPYNQGSKCRIKFALAAHAKDALAYVQTSPLSWTHPLYPHNDPHPILLRTARPAQINANCRHIGRIYDAIKHFHHLAVEDAESIDDPPPPVDDALSNSASECTVSLSFRLRATTLFRFTQPDPHANSPLQISYISPESEALPAWLTPEVLRNIATHASTTHPPPV
jgi:hypothetical protein